MTNSPENPDLILGKRTGWPEELRHLLIRYPREVWTGHANLGQMAQFWLDRHNMFRELTEALLQATHQLREGKVPPEQFRQWFAPRMNFLLGELQTHHMIEDQHYFPVFTRAETSLLKGFEILENDHEMIHHGLEDLARSAQILANAVDGDTPLLMKASDGFADVSDGFLKILRQHLADEEDLIIPVILDRTEAGLGIR
jgi:iron-sulfur cluster repair protein YtfE (RIC family)